MSSHVYHEIYLHLNWHVKHNYPSLRGDLEELAHGMIRRKCELIKGVHLHEIGGTDDHVHIAVNIEPFVKISELVQEIKGFSSFEVNRRSGSKRLEWQRGYGVVSFGLQNLPWVRQYIQTQREHHANGTAIERLERHDLDDESPAQAG